MFKIDNSEEENIKLEEQKSAREQLTNYKGTKMSH